MVKKVMIFAASVIFCIGAMTGIAYAAYSGKTETIENEIRIGSQRKEHKVTFELTGGSWVDGYTPPDRRTYETELILPTADHVIREGYQFAGWYQDAEYSGEVQTLCGLDQKEDIIYYAKWRGNAYLMSGMDFNKTVKTLANGTATGYNTMDYLIKGVQWAEEIPYGSTTAVVTTDTSDHEIVAFFDDTNGIINLVNKDDANVYMDSDSSYMFNRFAALTSVDMTKFISEKVTDIKYIFCECVALEELSLKDMDTSKVTTLKAIFAYCENLVTLDLSGWNVERAQNLSSMFIECNSLANLNLDGWNPVSATEMSSTFSRCYALENLDIADWDTKKLKTTYYMFSSCSRLKNLDLSGWDTSSLTRTQRMFDDCNALRTIDLSGWDTSKVTNMANMFQNTYMLSEIRMDQFDMSAVTNKGGMMYRAANSTRSCTIYCTEETESALLDGTSMTSSYFTFVHPETAVSLALREDTDVISGSNAGEKETEIASGSNAEEKETEVASGSNAEEKETEVASGSNAEEKETEVASGSNAEEKETVVASGSNAEY